MPSDTQPPRRRTFEFRALGEGDTTTLAGHASVWGSLNSYDEVFVPGAFERTLAEKSDRKPLVMTLEHRTAIGRWTEHREDDVGLYLSGAISQTTAGRDAAILARDGVLTGLSVGFGWDFTYRLGAPNEEVSFDTSRGKVTYRFDQWVTYLLDVDLVETGLVTAPSDDEARLTEVRSKLEQARRALPGIADDASWEDAAYSMALLMGGRGSAAFQDLPEAQHRQLYERIAAHYQRHGHEPPPYERSPIYDRVEFRHDEREVFTDRYLRKSLASVVAGVAGVTRPLSGDTREKAQEAVSTLQALIDRDRAPALLADMQAALERAKTTLATKES